LLSLPRSQISENFDLEDYLIDSGSGSRIRPRDGGAADSAAFSERVFKQTVSLFPFPLVLEKSALKRARSGCLRAL
jgi:hypothetical protein